MSKIQITNPLSKGSYKTFWTQLIQIHFFQPQDGASTAIDNWKNILFPPEQVDADFNNLTQFILLVMDQLVKTSKDTAMIKEDLDKDYEYNSDTFSWIETTVESQRNDIINFVNKEFMINENEFKKWNWATKTVLSGKGEGYYNKKFADLEFVYSTNTENNDSKKVNHKVMTFTKDDINKLMKELVKINKNLQEINSIK